MGSIRSTIHALPHLLWIEPSQALLKLVQQRLKKVPCHFVESPTQAALFLEQQSVDAVLLAEHTEDKDAFIQWLQQTHPLVDILVSTETEVDIAPESEWLWVPRQELLKHPDDTILGSIQQSDFQGELRHVSLFELTRLFSLSDSGKRLKVYDPGAESHGELFFKDRTLIAAQLGDEEGEPALVKIMGLEKGFFAELPWQEPDVYHFQEPYDSLMMKAAQYLDESSQSNSPKKREEKSTLEILAIDHNRPIQHMYQAFFSRYGHTVQSALNSNEALRLLEQKRYDVILLEIAMEDEKGKRILKEIQRNAYPGKVIIVSDTQSAAVRQYCISRGAIKYFSKPLSLKELYTFLRYLFAQRSFRGTLKYMSLLDLVQLLTMGTQSHRIEIRSGDTKGWLYFEKGRLIHANWGALRGEEACFGILRLESGTYREHVWNAPPGENVQLSPGQLLLKAANYIPLPSTPAAADIQTRFGEQLNVLKDLRNWLHAPIEESGKIRTLALGQSRLSDTLQLSEQRAEPLKNLIPLFLSLGVELRFDQQGTLEQMGFIPPFKGATEKSLRLGDVIEKAVILYGSPQYQDEDCAIWDQMCVFIRQKHIERLYFGAI